MLKHIIWQVPIMKYKDNLLAMIICYADEPMIHQEGIILIAEHP